MFQLFTLAPIEDMREMSLKPIQIWNLKWNENTKLMRICCNRNNNRGADLGHLQLGGSHDQAIDVRQCDVFTHELEKFRQSF